MTPKVLPLGDRGLDLVLSGGLRWVERVAGVAGASILVRGPAGSGKTLMGVTLARALARQLGGPVAYGCVELLPTELEAQVRSLFPADGDLVVRHSPFDAEVSSGAVSILASLLELGGDPDQLGEALDRMWADVGALGVTPKVVVIDSLIEGYGIGSNVSREFADAICKLTARWGVALILLEECGSTKASPWAYAVDTVIELETEGDEGAAKTPERWLRVPKHRFGPSDIGPHRFVIQSGIGIAAYPRASTWLEPWATPLVDLPNHGPAPQLSRKVRNGRDLTFKGPNIAVFGSESSSVLRLARSLKPTVPAKESQLIWYDFQSPLSATPTRSGSVLRVGLGHPYLTAEHLLSRMLDRELFGEAVSHIIISDVRTIRSANNTNSLRNALATFCSLTRSWRIPSLLVETAPMRFGAWHHLSGDPRSRVVEAGITEPDVVHFSDDVVEVITDDWNGGGLLQVRVTNPTAGTLTVIQASEFGPL